MFSTRGLLKMYGPLNFDRFNIYFSRYTHTPIPCQLTFPSNLILISFNLLPDIQLVCNSRRASVAAAGQLHPNTLGPAVFSLFSLSTSPFSSASPLHRASASPVQLVSPGVATWILTDKLLTHLSLFLPRFLLSWIVALANGLL